MPIYEYQCSKCDHRLEALQKISDAPLTECPRCHEQSLQKLISAASFRLKGGGWYETDFKTGGRKQLADSDSAEPDKAKPDADKSAGNKESKKANTGSNANGKQSGSTKSNGTSSQGSKSQTPAGDS